jgi:CopG family transcriptional regulator / antitoxin EndoAI
MATNTVNISFRKDLLKQIDQVAKEESRSRSELIREAARMYIERKSRWKTIFNYGSKIAKDQRLSEQDIVNEISRHRKSRKSSS